MSKSLDEVWHLVVTVPGNEFLAQHALRMRSYHAWLPFNRIRRRIKRAHGRHIEVWQPKALFPGYFFACVGEAQDVAGINAAEFVSTVVYSGDRALVVPGSVMEQLRGRAGRLTGFAGKIDETAPGAVQRYLPGDEVRFVEGSPLVGWLATVEFDKNRQIRVFCHQLRRIVMAKAEHIEPV